MRHPASRPASHSTFAGLLTRTIFRPALLLILSLFSSFSALALAYGCKVDGIYYDITPANRTASVTRVSYSGGVIIPETIAFDGTTYSVTSIGDGAFANHSGLTSVTIPNSVTSIGNYAFFNCSGLTSVTIPNSVTTIGEFAFAYCSGLTSVIFNAEKCTKMISAFSDCTNLTSLTIGDKVTIIPNFAFPHCSKLTSVTIPNSVTSIGDSAFNGCSGLSSVTIGNSVTSIGKYAFHNCSGLTSVVVDKDNSTYDSRNNCNAIIETSTNNLIVGCKNTIIPNSVTSIGDCAFYNCSGLTSVTIPNSVTFIGKYAFEDCSGLTKLVSLAVEPPTCDNGTFKEVDKTTCQLIVPQESINKYKTADQWKEFLNILGYNGVDDVSVDSQNAVYEVYNLQGVRVGIVMREAEVTTDTLPHGVYILVSPQGRKKIQI